jgi:glycerol-3-phosphate acyltransferase PlsY
MNELIVEILYNLSNELARPTNWPWIIISYVIGSIPFGFLKGKIIKGPDYDIRKDREGSGSMGSANGNRLLGKRAGTQIKMADISKGIVVILIAYILIYFNFINRWGLVLVGSACVLGHCFPIFLWLAFSGKGASTTMGVLIMTNPISAIAGYATREVVIKATKKSSYGTILGVIVALATSIALYATNYLRIEYLAILGILTMIIILTHIPNMIRIIKGKENKIDTT